MDLVDIDQVLDNLELCEAADESRAAASAAIAAAARPVPAINDGMNSNGINSASSTPKTSTLPQKNFVGVSQVFNSLDDYCKNVESLETASKLHVYDEECRSIPATPSNENVVKRVERAAAPLPSADEYDHYDVGEEEACSDIYRFREQQRNCWSQNTNTEDVEQNMSGSSDSLTTSSSSTFSSGPSPGAASTADEHSVPLSPVHAVEERSEGIDGADEQVETNNVSLVQPPITEEQLDSSSMPVEDLAQGLSTISLTTSSTPNSQLHLPYESNVSSALKNVLDELSSDTASTSFLSQRADEPKFEAPLTQEVDEHKPQEQVAAELLKPAFDTGVCDVATAVKSNKRKPITFGSTMDEISDAELDSLLQEMDVDEGEHGASKLECINNKEELTEADSSEASNNLVDCANGDSLSQASTVEFSEVRAQAQMTEAQAQSPNSIASSYTSSESSSLDGEEALSADGEAEDEVETSGAARPMRPTSLDLSTVKTNLYVNAGQTPPGNTTATEAEAASNSIAASTSIQPPNMEQSESTTTGYNDPNPNLGKIPPIWVPDNQAPNCMTCQTKFTMIKRRHHCRACGKVLCSVCCSQKFKLEFLEQPESRVCVQCYIILVDRQRHVEEPSATPAPIREVQLPETDANVEEVAHEISVAGRSPNPNNPMEYCSTIPPYRQVNASAALQPPPTVIVPVGVLKKDCSYSSTSSNSSSKQQRKRKSVMFSDGIGPGSDLATLEHEQWHEAKQARNSASRAASGSNAGGAAGNKTKPSTPVRAESSGETSTAMGIMASLFRGALPPAAAAATVNLLQSSYDDTNNHNQGCNHSKKANTASKKADSVTSRLKRLLPMGYDENGCFIPTGDNNKLPPIYTKKDDRSIDYGYKEVVNNTALLERLQNETLNFALDKNFFVRVKIVHLKCCMNRTVINFTTCGMHFVGNDEIIVLLELTNKDDLSKEPPLPKEIFQHFYDIYTEAEQGRPIGELAHSSPKQSNFLGSREYGGFIYIRNTYQCLQDVIVPENPFLIGLLIHRYEVPWAKVFPLRLMLRLGAQYRYYPCPHISMRNRESVYAEIAQTIINLLADFRNFTYTLPSIRGMYIHMEDRRTTVLIPRNRLEEVIKAINNASDHILAFGGNFSKAADGHLVCMQNVNDDRNEMYSYSTQAINIQGQPRRVTGASFFVLNEALKSSSGLSGKCSIVEDGLMVQIMPNKMEEVRNALRNQKDIDIVCGPLNATDEQTETVSIKWTDYDRDFNVGVVSPIDGRSLEGISSVRVHASFNYSNASLTVRLTEIYVIKYDEWYNTETSNAALPLDITRLAGQISRSVSMAMVSYLDLLVQNGIDKFALRATLHQDNVCYEAGALGTKLPPLYMNALDDHLISTLHNESTAIEEAIILELKFYILSV